ncbi:MAG: hypothetical protein F4Y02_14350 [Chloroflexi bacterium]|nr:hypothetical protein [Chloroflexota bacterium]
MTRTLSAGDDLAPGFAVADGTEAVRQRVVQRLRLFRGEAFTDADAGVPYIPDLLGARLPSALAASIVRSVLLSVDGVEDVLRIEVDLDGSTRQLSIDVEARADDGTTVGASVTL